jgi:hypothetical protein
MARAYVPRKRNQVFHFPAKIHLSSDPQGIRVRPIEGIEGIDYISPGALTNSLSYVMGPLIQVMRL